jgi:hypothetical protein
MEKEKVHYRLGYLQQRNANVNLHFEFNCSVMQMTSNRVTQMQMQMHFAFQGRGYVNMHILSHAFFRIHLSLKENTYSVGDTKFYMTYAYTIQHAFIILPL